MDRKEEIIELLKSLLSKADDAIDDNQYSEDGHDILESATKLNTISKKIDVYLAELKTL